MGDFANIVLESVAELTGYPIEMLDLDMDMEADLGIDSIKRLEILGAVQKRVPEMAEVNSQVHGFFADLAKYHRLRQGRGVRRRAVPGRKPPRTLHPRRRQLRHSKPHRRRRPISSARF